MNATVDGPRYDTEKASKLGEIAGNTYTPDTGDDGAYERWEALWMTISGRFFLCGEGTAKTRWFRGAPPENRRHENDGELGWPIRAIPEDQAQAWVEKYRTADVYEQFWDVEDAQGLPGNNCALLHPILEPSSVASQSRIPRESWGSPCKGLAQSSHPNLTPIWARSSLTCSLASPWGLPGSGSCTIAPGVSTRSNEPRIASHGTTVGIMEGLAEHHCVHFMIILDIIHVLGYLWTEGPTLAAEGSDELE